MSNQFIITHSIIYNGNYDNHSQYNFINDFVRNRLKDDTGDVVVITLTDGTKISVGQLNSVLGLCDDCSLEHYWEDFFPSNNPEKRVKLIELFELK